MRRLFRSEQRVLEEVIRNERGIALDLSALQVVEELQDVTKGSRSFNSGFWLKFGAVGEASGERTCIGQPILPRTLGLELFLMVDKVLGFPQSLELLTGSGIESRYFIKPWGHLKDRLATMLPSNIQNALPKKPLVEFPYVRVFWIYDDVSFLIFSGEYSTVLRSSPLLYHDVGNNHDISIHAGANQYCIDGWINYRPALLSSNSMAYFRPKSSGADK